MKDIDINQYFSFDKSINTSQISSDHKNQDTFDHEKQIVQSQQDLRKPIKTDLPNINMDNVSGVEVDK